MSSLGDSNWGANWYSIGSTTLGYPRVGTHWVLGDYSRTNKSELYNIELVSFRLRAGL
jgi:hypothetical protein